MVIGALLATVASTALADKTNIKFQLDWRFEGPAALFLVAKSKGYFAQDDTSDFAVEDISLQTQAGEFIAIVGLSG
ncbi:MAG: ABC-type nitrate/sulfonate/bicarbonate transport system substrate-binding protein [Candidatus Paceibacteria bacterium]